MNAKTAPTARDRLLRLEQEVHLELHQTIRNIDIIDARGTVLASFFSLYIPFALPGFGVVVTVRFTSDLRCLLPSGDGGNMKLASRSFFKFEIAQHRIWNLSLN